MFCQAQSASLICPATRTAILAQSNHTEMGQITVLCAVCKTAEPVSTENVSNAVKDTILKMEHVILVLQAVKLALLHRYAKLVQKDMFILFNFLIAFFKLKYVSHAAPTVSHAFSQKIHALLVIQIVG